MNRKETLTFVRKLENFYQKINNNRNHFKNVYAKNDVVDRLYKLIQTFNPKNAKAWLEDSGIISQATIDNKFDKEIDDMKDAGYGVDLNFPIVAMNRVNMSKAEWFANVSPSSPITEYDILNSISYLLNVMKSRLANKEDVIKTQDKIVKAIKDHSTIILQRHQLPDPDAIGSQMGLANIINTSFSGKHVYCVGSYDHNLAWLGNEDKINDDKYKNALVIVTDCANRGRISNGIKDTHQNKNRFNLGNELIKIDHHPNVDSYGDIQWVNPKASSASEMVYDLVANHLDLRLNNQGAGDIYAGIVGDTGRFMYPETSSHTLLVASQLAKYDFSMSEINQKEVEITPQIARLSADVYQHAHFLKNGGAYYIATTKMMNKLHVNSNDVMPIVHLLGNIKGVKAWLIFMQQPTGGYRVSLRSHKIAIDKLATKYGGGGHALASGTFVKDLKSVKMMIKDLNHLTTKNG